MSERETGGPAFARAGAEHSQGGNYEQDGMSLRDYIAVAAMSGTLTTAKASREDELPMMFRMVAKMSYEMADAMLEARK